MTTKQHALHFLAATTVATVATLGVHQLTKPETKSSFVVQYRDMTPTIKAVQPPTDGVELHFLDPLGGREKTVVVSPEDKDEFVKYQCSVGWVLKD